MRISPTFIRLLDDWEVASDEVKEHLGVNGIERIRECFAENCKFYLTSVPDLFRPGLLTDPAFEKNYARAQPGQCANPFLEYCAPIVRDRLLRLYEELKLDGTSEVPLQSLMYDVLPTARFTGVCVYTADPATDSLIPQLQSGSIGLRRPLPLDLTQESSIGDPLVEAYLSDNILQEHKGMSAQALLTAVCGAFGSSQRLGVLYAEIPTSCYDAERRQHQLHFKAICQALNDCLRLV